VRKPVQPTRSAAGRRATGSSERREDGSNPRPIPEQSTSDIETIPAAISPARAGKRAPDPAADRVVRSAERFAEAARLRRRLALRKYLIALAVVAAIGGGIWLIGFSQFFELRETDIEIAGSGELVAQAQVREVAASHVGTPLARLDLDEIGEQIEQVRGVSTALVRRSWPHGIRVSLTERVVVAAVQASGTHVLLDASGERVGEVEEVPEDVPLARVPLSSGRESSLAAVLTVLDEIPEELRAEIIDIGADTRDTVYFTLDGEVRVEWGSSDDSALKASVLSVLRSQEAQVYDVSAPTMPVTRDRAD